MPRDDWQSERNKDAAKRGKRKHKGRSRGMSAAAKAASIERLSSPETMLWFGKHKGQKVRDVPRSYLQWLLNSKSDREHWRMEALKGFLRQYLAR